MARDPLKTAAKIIRAIGAAVARHQSHAKKALAAGVAAAQSSVDKPGQAPKLPSYGTTHLRSNGGVHRASDVPAEQRFAGCPDPGDPS